MFELLLPSLALIVGAGLLLALAPALQPRWIAATVAGMALVLILVGTGTVGAPRQFAMWSSFKVLIPPLTFQANEPARFLGLALTAAAMAAILVAHEDDAGPESRPRGAGLIGIIRASVRSWREKIKCGGLDWAFALVTLAAGWIALLPTNLLTLAMTWAILDGVVAIAWLCSAPPAGEDSEPGAALRWGTGVLATLLLWSAALPLQASHALLRIESLPPQEWAGTMLILAIILRLAPYPFHLFQGWVRPLRRHVPTNTETHLGADKTKTLPGSARRPLLATVSQLASGAAGIWLLAQISGWEAMPFLSRQIVSSLLLTGLVVSGLLAVLSGGERQATGWIMTGQAGIVVLAGLWCGPKAALAEGMVLILAGGLLSLLSHMDAQSLETRIAGWVGVGALAGLPLTWGGDGRFLLYAGWLREGPPLHLLLASGGYLLLLAAAARPLFHPPNRPLARQERLAAGGGLGLLALGLLLRSGPIAAATGPVWLAILIPLGGGVLLAWGAESLRPLQQAPATRLWDLLTLCPVHRLAEKIAGRVGAGVRGAHDVLEGEGALLWVLILLALGWLLLAAGSPG
ncbi:MAG: hypothetical protein GQ526_01025 [Ardenticatenales bacterium]|nr:hypothetical protein [Ardenticatenales bacterium]